jgi:hypothetical protein
VLSRLSAARDQIKEGLEKMEKYSHISYAPKQAHIGIWGNAGLQGEPFTLVRSEIEMNVLILAYENPVSVRGIGDTMGMPSAYLEPIIDGLVSGELMGRTPGGLVYTRCFVQSYADSFGNIPEQESLAARYAARVWETAWRVLEPLTEREEFAKMSDVTRRGFETLRLDGYARFDYIMDEEGEIFCLEANTLPGMTPTSLMPQEAAAVGISYDELCDKIAKLAYNKKRTEV